MRTALLLTILSLTALPSSAHFPEGFLFQAFQFPDANVPQMDGDLNDWKVVPQEYFFDFTDHEEKHRGIGAAHDTTDHHIKRVAMGWNDSLNRLYFMAEVYDDVYRFDKENTDSLDTYYSRLKGAYVHGADIWEIVIDADHGGELVVNFDRENHEVEMRHRSAYVQNYHLYMPPLNGTYWHWLWGKALWTDDPAYSGVGWHYEGEHMSSGTVTYECYLTPFDDLHPDGPDSSVVHNLKENAVIGLSWAFLDADTSATTYDAFWSLSKQEKMYCSGEYLADFRLMPVDSTLFAEGK